MKRPHNEDAYFNDDQIQLYVVADGMGGHAAGEVASWEAVQAVHGMIKQSIDRVHAFRDEPNEENLGALRRLLESGIQAATYMVFGIAQQDPEHKGMGTTITASLVVNDTVVVGSVGDSRAYLVRSNKTYQVTEDHTLVQLQLKAGLVTEEQAKRSSKGNVITRAVGPRDYVQVDTFVVPGKVGDRYMLCSDGLHGYLETNEIAPLVSASTLEQAAKDLIKLANARGGKDNITTVIFEMID